MKKSLVIFSFAVILLVVGCAKTEKKTTESPVATEDVQQENNEVQQNDADNTSENADSESKVDDYLTTVKEKSDAINTSLEQEELTQMDMNAKAQELYKLWDDALNYMWDELQNSLSEDEFSKLQDEQKKWVDEKENKMNDAGKEFEGGSLYQFAVDCEGARLNEERTNELYKLLTE